VRRGMHLGGLGQGAGAGESGRRRGAVAELRRDITRARRRGHRGERAGDDAHLHAELRQWAEVTER
jgi:hypothetical protein